MVGLQQPVGAVIERSNPAHGTFGELDFLGRISLEGQARNHGMLKARAKGSPGLV